MKQPVKMCLLAASMLVAAPAYAWDRGSRSFMQGLGQASFLGGLELEMVTGMYASVTVPVLPYKQNQVLAYWIGVQDYGYQSWIVQSVLAFDPSANEWYLLPEYFNHTTNSDQKGTRVNVRPGDSIALEVYVTSINTATCSDSWLVSVTDYTTDQGAESTFTDVPCTYPGEAESGNEFIAAQEFQFPTQGGCADTPSLTFDGVTVWYGDGEDVQFLNYPFDGTTATYSPINLPTFPRGYNASISSETCAMTF